MTLRPGATPLASWRDIYFGAGARLDERSRAAVEAGAHTVERIIAQGVPVYGISAEFEDPNDVRAHGRDERVPVQSYFDAVDYWHDLVRELAGK